MRTGRKKCAEPRGGELTRTWLSQVNWKVVAMNWGVCEPLGCDARSALSGRDGTSSIWNALLSWGQVPRVSCGKVKVKTDEIPGNACEDPREEGGRGAELPGTADRPPPPGRSRKPRPVLRPIPPSHVSLAGSPRLRPFLFSKMAVLFDLISTHVSVEKLVSDQLLHHVQGIANTPRPWVQRPALYCFGFYLICPSIIYLSSITCLSPTSLFVIYLLYVYHLSIIIYPSTIYHLSLVYHLSITPHLSSLCPSIYASTIYLLSVYLSYVYLFSICPSSI